MSNENGMDVDVAMAPSAEMPDLGIGAAGELGLQGAQPEAQR